MAWNTTMEFEPGACCGTGELAYFSSCEVTPGECKNAWTDVCWQLGVDCFETEEEAWKHTLNAMFKAKHKRHSGKFVYYLWFVKYPNERQYEDNSLRKVIRNYPGVVKLGSNINPNTGNRIDGYMIRN